MQWDNEYSPPLVGGVRGGGELLQKIPMSRYHLQKKEREIKDRKCLEEN